jgi:hypothetical protein
MKRAQAALEFLMTYGWAILVVLAAIGALAYFGVLSPDRFLPEKCTLPSGLGCIDFVATNSQISVIIANSLGNDVSNVAVGINGTGCSTTASGPTSLSNGVSGSYVFACTPASGKFQGTLSVTYTNVGTSLSHTKTGSITLAIP